MYSSTDVPFSTSDRVIYTASENAKKNLLYLQEAGTLKALRRHASSRSMLNSYLFFIVISGSGSFSQGGISYELHAGDCVFVSCITPYSHETSPDDLWELAWVHFNGNAMNYIFEEYKSCGGTGVFRSKNGTDLINSVESLIMIAGDRRPDTDILLNNTLSYLIASLCENALQKSADGLRRKSVDRVREYIKQHYTQKLTLEMLEKQFFVSRYHLARSFKELYGITIINYVLQLRMSLAKELLRFSDKSISEIGEICGMEDPSYFDRTFKRLEGMRPGEYRRLW